jgi:hypothetical protein
MVNTVDYAFRSDFARGHIAHGREDGRIARVFEGRPQILMKLLERRFGRIGGCWAARFLQNDQRLRDGTDLRDSRESAAV